MAQSVFRLCREILRDFKRSQPLDEVTWPQVKQLIRESTSNEQVKTLQTFLYYIRSSAKHRELICEHAKGERSVEESAQLVGLKVPENKLSQ